MKLKMRILVLIITAAFLMSTGCKKEDGHIPPIGKNGNLAALYNADVPLAWFKEAVSLSLATPGTTGPVASRTFGYMGLALYESVVPGMSDNKTIQHQLNGLPSLPRVDDYKFYFYSVSANAALANMTRHMFGNASTAQNATIDSLENAFNTEFKSFLSGPTFDHFVSGDFDRSVQFGQDISNAIYNWSTTDGGDKAYLKVFPTDYVPPVGPGLWVPQTGQAAQHPYWGNNRTFVADNATTTQPGPPPSYSTDPASQFYKEELEVYNESINQDPEHRVIALYWAAIPPPTVSISILSAVLTDKNADLSLAAEAFCKLGIAISDAFVSCYKTKYTV